MIYWIDWKVKGMIKIKISYENEKDFETVKIIRCFVERLADKYDLKAPGKKGKYHRIYINLE